MIDFFNILEFNHQNYQRNGNVGYDNYKGSFLFAMSDLVSFGTDFQLMFYISTRFLKYNIDGILVPQFQLAYICNTAKFCIIIWFSCALTCIICGGRTNSCTFKSGGISLSLKTIIIDIIMFIPKNNPPGYKECVIYFILFSLG